MKNNTQLPKSYEAGKTELEQIRQRIEKNDFNMDDLEHLIDRGKFLLDFLTEKLKNMDQKLDDKFKN